METQQNPYCKAIRTRMEEKGYSMRCLARKSGISPATVSRILNGRQDAGMKQLGRIAGALELPVAALLTEEEKGRESLPLPLAGQTGITDINELEEKVNAELRRYEEFALTQEGQRMIENRFEEKLNSVQASGVFIEELKELYGRLKAGGLTKRAYMMIGGALLYFIVPMDIIPDYLFGMGYLDDLLALQAVYRSLKL